MSNSTVLYDLPGPRAIIRNRILALITVLIILGFVAGIGFRFYQTGQFSSSKWEVFTYQIVWVRIGEAMLATLRAFVVAGILSLVFGLVLSLGRMSDHMWVRTPFTLVIEVLRAVPVLIMMMLMYYGLPAIGQTWVTPYIAVVTALVLYNGSVLAEAIRAGVESLARGQSEAAYALGLRKSGVMRFVLLPQALRAMLPVIVAQLVVTLKDTALGSIITYDELLRYARFLGSSATYDSPYIPVTIVIGVIYIAMCLLLSGIAKWIEIRTRRSSKVLAQDEKPAQPPLEQVI